jgi:hypothetical protein
VSDGTVLESLRCLRLVLDKSHGENQLATTGGILYAIPPGPFNLHQEAPATSYKRRPAR